MAQDPLKVDQISIEPSAAGTRLIDRDPVTGALRLQDSIITTPVNLNTLAGLRSISNVFIVGKNGVGAEYSTIQLALDAVPANASPTNPYLVLVMPGEYVETVNIIKDGISLVGLGLPAILDPLYLTPNAAGNDHTVIISAQGGTTPQFCRVEGFQILNMHDNKAALRVVEPGAASTVGGNGEGITVKDCRLTALSPGGNRPVWVTAVNTVQFENCVMLAGIAGSVVAEETANFGVDGGRITCAVVLRWDTANALPADGASPFVLRNIHDIGASTNLVPAISADLDGGGKLVMSDCTMSSTKRFQFSGTTDVEIYNSTVGILSVLETITVKLYNSHYFSTLAANANAKLDTYNEGIAAFAAVATGAVVFDVPMSDSGYRVGLELDSQPANDETPWVTNKLVTGFTINFTTAQTLNAAWRATRR